MFVCVRAMLFNHCECSEEGTRNVVAECLGKLTLIDPQTLLPQLKVSWQITKTISAYSVYLNISVFHFFFLLADVLVSV